MFNKNQKQWTIPSVAMYVHSALGYLEACEYKVQLEDSRCGTTCFFHASLWTRSMCMHIAWLRSTLDVHSAHWIICPCRAQQLYFDTARLIQHATNNTLGLVPGSRSGNKPQPTLKHQAMLVLCERLRATCYMRIAALPAYQKNVRTTLHNFISSTAQRPRQAVAAKPPAAAGSGG